MKSKIKTPVPRNRVEMEALVNTMADLELKIAETVARRNVYLASVNDDWDPKIADLMAQHKAHLKAAHKWADASPAEFGDRKSIEFPRGTVGYRTGNFALKTLNGFTWKRVLQSLKTLTGKRYVRVSEEVDKEKIISARNSITDAEFKNFGVKVEQKKAFYVEGKVAPVVVERKVAA